jgi:NADPH:quinone reductase
MRAIVLHETGGPEVLRAIDWPTPDPGPGEARVCARAIGVGRPDVLIRTGAYKWMPPLPAIPGNELAGEVDAVGAGVDPAWLGRRVLLSARELPQRGGGYAQWQCAPAEALYPLPEAVAFDDAVSLPNFQLALALLFGVRGARPVPDTQGLKAVLVTAAAGGVSGALVQLARAHGLQVIATARSEAKRAFALTQGADAALDTADPALPEQVLACTGGRGVDLALDAIGGAAAMACLRSLAPLGTLVSYNVMAGLPEGDVFRELRARLGMSLGVRVFSMHTFDQDSAVRRGLMTQAVALMTAGRITAPPNTVLPLDQAAQAHRLLDDGEVLGKLVLRP